MGNEERKCMYGVDWVSNVSLFGDQRYFCTIGKYFPWWKQKCLEIVFQTFFSATKDISNLFTLFYIMILVFVRSLHSQPVRQVGLVMDWDGFGHSDTGRRKVLIFLTQFEWIYALSTPLLHSTISRQKSSLTVWKDEQYHQIGKWGKKLRSWNMIKVSLAQFNLNQSLRYGNP